MSSGHPVRDRLLARAAAVAEQASPSPFEDAPAPSPVANPAPLPDADPLSAEAFTGEGLFGFESLSGLKDDLDSIGCPEASPAPQGGEPPQMSGLLGGVVAGSVGLALLFAFLIQGAPREPLVLDRAASAVVKPLPPAHAAAVVAQAEPLAEPLPPLDAVVHAPRSRAKGPWRIEHSGSDPELRVIRAPVGKDSFLVSTQAAGVPLGQAYRAIKAFEGTKNFDRCRPRDEFVALLDRSTGKLKAFEYVVSREEIYQARTGDDGLLHGAKLDLKVKRQRARGVIRLQGGFESSASRGGFEAGLARVVNKALAGYTTTSEMKPGDVLALIAQEVTVLGDFERYAGIEALEYRRLGEKPLRIYYQDAGKTRGYVDAKGRMFGKGRWAKPVKGAVRTSKFNPRRMHPILKRIKPHNGTDYAAASGTPVMAAATAKVKFVGKMGPNGNFIRLSHKGGYETGYSHLSRFAKGLKAGQSVKQHQVIGYIGTTGRSTGPHLHFSAKKKGRFIDPESLDLDAFARLPVSDRKQLKRLRDRYDQLLALLEIPEPQKLAPSPVSVAVLAAEPAATAVPETAPAKPLSIYLTDLELMQQQSESHAGEVERSALRQQ